MSRSKSNGPAWKTILPVPLFLLLLVPLILLPVAADA